MKLVFDKVLPKQKDLFFQLSKTLDLPMEVIDMTEEEEDEAILRAIQLSVNDESASPEEVADFRAFLKS